MFYDKGRQIKFNIYIKQPKIKFFRPLLWCHQAEFVRHNKQNFQAECSEL